MWKKAKKRNEQLHKAKAEPEDKKGGASPGSSALYGRYSSLNGFSINHGGHFSDGR